MLIMRRILPLVAKQFTNQNIKVIPITSVFNIYNAPITSNKLCFYSTHTTLPANDETGIVKKILKKVGLSKSSKTQLKRSSYMLYESVADGINYAEFFEVFHLPNTFNSWFVVTELHVWMLLLRAMAEGGENGEDGRVTRNCIVEAMWNDVNMRAKKLGADNPSGTRRQIQILSQQFQAALLTYDEGIMSDDKVLAGAIWRRFFEKNCDSFEIMEKSVEYVRKQVNMLDSTSRQDFLLNPKFKWIPLKSAHPRS